MGRLSHKLTDRENLADKNYPSENPNDAAIPWPVWSVLLSYRWWCYGPSHRPPKMHPGSIQVWVRTLHVIDNARKIASFLSTSFESDSNGNGPQVISNSWESRGSARSLTLRQASYSDEGCVWSKCRIRCQDKISRSAMGDLSMTCCVVVLYSC